MDDTILGLDIGTTSTKAVLFDLSGVELASAECGYRLSTPQPGWAEQNPEELWRAVLHVLRTVMNATAVEASPRGRPLALSLAAQSGSLLPARQDGTPLSPAITWLDGRTEALVRLWRAGGLEDKVRAVSGWHLYPGLCLPTIAWLRENQPDLFAAARRYLSVNDFLVHRLTGRFCTNPSNAAGMQLLDVTTAGWSPDLCALAGIRPDQLSPVLPSGTVVGPITPKVARLTGLPAGTIVVNGGHDQSCTALALGITSPGQVLLGCGTAWVVTGVADSPDLAALPLSLDLGFHPADQPGHRRWTVSQSLGGLGASLEWLLRQCWLPSGSEVPARQAAFAALDSELARTAPGSSGLFFLPIAGGHSAPDGDQRGALWGLRLDHARADMARAVMEGAAYELRWALEPVRQAGLPVDRLWMVGGATHSSIWPAIVAEVLAVPLSVPQGQHWPAVGAALLAAIGSGAFESIEAGLVRFQRPSRQIQPDPSTSQIYDECFATYRKLGVLR